MTSANGLKLEVRVPVAQCVDLQSAPTRNGQKKWLVRGSSCLLNPKYPLSMDERDQINFKVMVKLFRDDYAAMRSYYIDGPLAEILFTPEEKEFLDDSRALFDRFEAQPDFGPDMKFPHARDWLLAHGIKPAQLPGEIEVQANALQKCDFSDDYVLNLFDAENVRVVLEATGATAGTSNKAAMLQEYCKRVLHDDPNRPVELADFSAAVFVMESWKSVQRALFRGVGSKPKILTTRGELQAELRTLNVSWDPQVDSLTALWNKLNMYMFKRVSRADIVNWFASFGFELSDPVTQKILNPALVSKRVLFDMVGQFHTGLTSEVCDGGPVQETAAFKHTSRTTVLNFLKKTSVWANLDTDSKDDSEVLFKLYCAEKILQHGIIFRDASIGPEDKQPETRNDLIDELLEQGVYATMMLTDCQKQRIQLLLQLRPDTPQFATQLRAILKPFLTPEFLWSWLQLNHPLRLIPEFTTMFEEYVQASMCQRGVSVAPNQPFVRSGDDEIDEKVSNWTNKYNRPITATKKEFDNFSVCKAQNVAIAGLASSFSDHEVNVDMQGAVKTEFRRQRVRFFFELIDSLYMVQPHAGSLYDEYISKVSDKMIEAKLRHIKPTTADEKKLMVSDFNLWLHGMASEKVLVLLLAARELEEKTRQRDTKLETLLATIAESNYERFALVNGWSERRETGELCPGNNDFTLDQKLQLLSVPLVDRSTGKPLSQKRKIYSYMHILNMYLPEGVKQSLLTENEYRMLLEDKSTDPFASCFSVYCKQFNVSEEIMSLIVTFDANKAGSVMLSWTSAKQVGEEKSEEGATKVLQNQGVGCTKTLLREEELGDATIVEMVNPTMRRILSQEKGSLVVEHYTVNLDGTNVIWKNPISEPLWDVVVFFQSNGEWVHRIGDRIFSR